jgi:hypothetical protein
MFKSTPRSNEDPRWIQSDQLGVGPNRGIWASACYQDGEYGVMLACTQSEGHSAGFFIPESRLAEFRRILPKKYRGVFKDAVRRLPLLKASLAGSR